MSPLLSLAALLCVTLLLGALPFVPMLLEIRRKSDATRLPIALDHDGNIRHFANRFRAYMQSQLPGTTEGFAGDLSIVGRLQDGTPFVKAKGDVEPILPPYGEDERLTQRLLIAYASLALPEKTVFTQEVYAKDTLFGGAGDIYRAVLGDRDVLLARGSMVLRWLHGEGKVQVGRDSILYGRTSSEQLIRLAEGCRFARLHAPRIEFGTVPEAQPGSGPAAPTTPRVLPLGAVVTGRRCLIHGDLEIPSGSLYEGDLVVMGRLRVGTGTRLMGSVKSHRDLELGPGVQIAGSIVSRRSLRVGADCAIQGPVVAEREVTLGAGAQLGTETCPTTVSAPHIRVTPGVLVFGTVWAREAGEVTHAVA